MRHYLPVLPGLVLLLLISVVLPACRTVNGHREFDAYRAGRLAAVAYLYAEPHMTARHKLVVQLVWQGFGAIENPDAAIEAELNAWLIREIDDPALLPLAREVVRQFRADMDPIFSLDEPGVIAGIGQFRQGIADALEVYKTP
jgi:hypothetical protein